MILNVPSGIGDMIWIYSKLRSLGRPLTFSISDGYPRRTLPFVKLLPMVEYADYGPHTFNDIVSWSKVHPYKTWKDIEVRKFGSFCIDSNQHLMSGNELVNWLPDLPIDWHFEMKVPEEAKLWSEKLWSEVPTNRPTMAISAASYRGAEAWNSWKCKEWMEFVNLVKSWVPEMVFILLGGEWDDLTYILESKGNFVNFVGKADIAATIEILKKVDYYVGFCSGLGILRTTLGLQCFMLWPKFMENHMYNWVPPDVNYQASLWDEPVKVFNMFRKGAF